jgi:hypothetical protein
VYSWILLISGNQGVGTVGAWIVVPHSQFPLHHC